MRRAHLSSAVRYPASYRLWCGWLREVYKRQMLYSGRRNRPRFLARCAAFLWLWGADRQSDSIQNKRTYSVCATNQNRRMSTFFSRPLPICRELWYNICIRCYMCKFRCLGRSYHMQQETVIVLDFGGQRSEEHTSELQSQR